MSSPPDAPTSLLNFLNSFLQERNIRWILATGLAILFGSSVMLVTTHWHDAGPIWKYIVFLVYTGVLFIAGQYICPRLGLNRTSTVLLALVGLLLPVTFIAWRWTWLDAGSSVGLHVISAALLALNTALTAFAGRQIIRYLLRGDQFTFLGSYVLLCLAGAILPGCPVTLCLPAAIVLWGIFHVGAVKVNRHVFWLGEKLRLPRIFGFFPIALLATQFVGLIAFCIAPQVDPAWLGPICVLGALTILLTADAVARVYEQRTGGILWPWPVSIALPMAVGLITCVAGVALSSSAFVLARDGRPLVIAAGLAALLIERVARRTNRVVFAYATLLLVTIAYNFLPSFAIETARTVIAQSAHVVHEQRLPLAFYGLTYLPLLGGLLYTGRVLQRRGDTLFAVPIARYAVALSWLLLAFGTTHVKALAGVGLALTTIFAAHERLFRSPISLIGSIAAWGVACAGAVPFATTVLGLALPPTAPFLIFACGAAALSAVGALRRRRHEEPPFYEGASLFASLGLSLAFPIFVLAHNRVGTFLFGLPDGSPIDLTAWFAGLAIAGMMCVHCFRWRDATITTAAILFVQTLMFLVALFLEVSADNPLPLATLCLIAQWLVARVLRAVSTTTVSQIFGKPLANTLTCELSAALALGWLPLFALNICELLPWYGSPLQWLAAVAIIAWSFDQAVQYRHWFSAMLGMLSTLGLSCTVYMGVAGPHHELWLPTVCGATALVGIPIAEALQNYLRRRGTVDTASQDSAARAIERPLVIMMLIVFVGLAGWALTDCSVQSLTGGVIAGVGLAWYSLRSPIAVLRVITAAIVSWQIVMLPAHFTGLNGGLVWQLNTPTAEWLVFPVGLLAAGAFAVWNLFGRQQAEDVSAVIAVQRIAFGLLSIASGLLASLVQQPTAMQIAFALAAPLVVAAAFLYQTWRDQNEAYVWAAVPLVAVVFAHLLHWQLIVLGGQIAMFGILAAGIVTWGAGQYLADRGRLGIFSQPLRQIGYCLPALNIGVAAYKQFTLTHPEWLGPCSLALLFTAAFYFWRGLEEHRPTFLLLSGFIANLGLFLVWHELHFTNPQCYMIPLGATIILLTELLRREIPNGLRDPFRYLGAVVVLVSPVFDMLNDSWLPFVTLMAASVLVLFLAIGLRVRALMYASIGFLIADLAGMIVRGCVDHPQLLWAAGLGIGTAVVAVGALCELKREALLARVRSLSAALESWN